ncbi:hypothetical protein ACFL4W_02075 [Planctomycetota bacterium]
MRLIMISLLLVLVVAVSGLLASDIDPGKQETFVVPASSPHGILYVPSDYDLDDLTKTYPVMIYLGGMGGRPSLGPIKKATGGKEWFIMGMTYAELADKGGGPLKYDPAAFSRMAKHIRKTIVEMKKHYRIDERRVFLSGFSLGGWGISNFGMHRQARGLLAGYICIAAGPRRDNVTDFSVAKGLPVLVINGELDANLQTANRNTPLLKQAGADVTQIIVEAAPHTIPQDQLVKHISEWMKANNKPRPAADKNAAAIPATPAVLEGVDFVIPSLEEMCLQSPFLAKAVKLAKKKNVLFLAYNSHYVEDGSYAKAMEKLKKDNTFLRTFVILDAYKELGDRWELFTDTTGKNLVNYATPGSILGKHVSRPMVIIGAGGKNITVLEYASDSENQIQFYVTAANKRLRKEKDYKLFQGIAAKISDTSEGGRLRAKYIKSAGFPKDLVKIIAACRKKKNYAIIMFTDYDAKDRKNLEQRKAEIRKKFPSFAIYILPYGNALRRVFSQYSIPKTAKKEYYTVERDRSLIVGPDGVMQYGGWYQLFKISYAETKFYAESVGEVWKGNITKALLLLKLCNELTPKDDKWGLQRIQQRGEFMRKLKAEFVKESTL